MSMASVLGGASALDLLRALYSVLGLGMAFSYIPQAIAAWRDAGRAEAISLVAWGFWTTQALVGALYAFLVVGDAVLSAVSGASFVGCAATTAIALGKRLGR